MTGSVTRPAGGGASNRLSLGYFRCRNHPGWLYFAALLAVVLATPSLAAEKLDVGSKEFAESWILGEAVTALAKDAGAEATHHDNLGGTEIVYAALKKGSVDVYPDYTGTIAQVMLKSKGRPSLEEMRQALAPQGVGISDSLGFNDGYALAVTADTQQKYNLHKISDLAAHPDLRCGFTHEFVGRQDGWLGLAQTYGLRMASVTGMQHQLAYEAISSGKIDLMEIYTTDSKIQKLGLTLLDDDRGFFPRYDAVLLYRLDLPRRAPDAWKSILRLVGKINEAEMTRANAMVELDKKRPSEAAAMLLNGILGPGAVAQAEGGWTAAAKDISQATLEHLQLVGVSLLAAILVGIPLGVLATRSRAMRTVALSTTGLLQTIPSLALLAFFIPIFGIGFLPAAVALFLYSLLPIVRNTYTGLANIPPNLSEAADVLGLTPRAKLFRVNLPMASPSIMAGIKTSAVINVGTATIAAFIGAGGLGALIKRGIDLQNHDLLLQGAVPAALLALAVQWAFDVLDVAVIPKGLRLPGARG